MTQTAASQFVPITGLSTTLTATLGKADKYLPIEITPTLSKQLPTTAFTYLTIRSEVDTEVVKAFIFDDKLCIERGQDDTQATAFPAGSCVSGDPTWAGIKELICTYDCCQDTTTGETTNE